MYQKLNFLLLLLTISVANAIENCIVFGNIAYCSTWKPNIDDKQIGRVLIVKVDNECSILNIADLKPFFPNVYRLICRPVISLTTDALNTGE
jgi:hypothetical protein